jgi:hypothetical protein
MTIKTFRGLLGDGQQERIRLQTLDGKKGYRIKKFELMLWKPGIVIQESVVEIHSILPPAPTGIVNFSNQTLLAAGVLQGHDSSAYQFTQETIFDGITFNQDIFITHIDVDGTASINYYLELETVSLDDVEATAVILKNFRNTNTV